MNIQSIKTQEWPHVHSLMLKQKFPGVPLSYRQASCFFEEAEMYGLYEEKQLKAAFLFMEAGEESAYFDVLCAPQFHGKWATIKTLQSLYTLAFERKKLRCLWVETHDSKSLKAALSMGFVPVAKDEEVTTLVLTPHQVNQRFKTQTKGKDV